MSPVARQQSKANRKKQFEQGKQKPPALIPDFDGIPGELKKHKQWVVWDYVKDKHKWIKKPLKASTLIAASSTNKNTWTSLGLAKLSYDRGGISGIGFVFDVDDVYTGIDLDNCRNESGELTTDAQVILARFNTYAEISPSGTGVKLWLIGDVRPFLRGQAGSKKGNYEVYSAKRYFTVTGRGVGNTTTIASDQQENLKWFVNTYLSPKQEPKVSQKAPSIPTNTIHAASDQDIWDAISKSKSADKVNRLKSGDISEYGDDQSSADLALASHLAFFFGPDPDRIERAFNSTELAKRGKWQNRPDYRKRTIDKSLEGKTEFFQARESKHHDSGSVVKDITQGRINSFLPVALVKEHDDDPHRLARAYLTRRGYYDNNQSLWKWQEAWFKWDVQVTCYREVSQSQIKDELCSFIKQEFDRLIIENKKSKKKARKVTASIIHNTFNALSSMCLLKPQYVPSMPAWLGVPSEERKWIAVANGLLDIDAIWTADSLDQCLIKPTPQWFSLSCMPVTFDPDAECPKWEQFLLKTFDGDAQIIDLLQEWFGYCLTHETKYQRFLVMVSEGGHGKGVIAAVIEALIGKDNMSFNGLDKFGERFGLYATLGKHVNLVADANEIDRVAEGNLKSFVVGDQMQFEKKHQDSISARPTAKLHIFTNKLPNFSDRSQGIWRRLLVVPLNKVVRENEVIVGMDKPEWWHSDPREVSGIFNWAIVGLCRLMEHNRFTVSEKVTAAVEGHKLDCNHARRFLVDHCSTDEHDTVDCDELYAAYNSWSKANGFLGIMNSSNFGKEVFKAFPEVEKARGGTRNERQWQYKGLRVDLVS